MTYREQLAKEHPGRVSSGVFGGCFDRWDREIPAESEEFEPGKSYAEFTDGHREEIFYYSMAPDGGHILFTTRSGIYLFEDRYEEICMYSRFSEHTRSHPFLRQRHFYRISYDAGGGLLRDSIDYIKTVMIDTRVKHDYCMTLKDDRKITGSVWVERDAPVEKIREMIWDDVVATITTETADA